VLLCPADGLSKCNRSSAVDSSYHIAPQACMADTLNPPLLSSHRSHSQRPGVIPTSCVSGEGALVLPVHSTHAISIFIYLTQAARTETTQLSATLVQMLHTGNLFLKPKNLPNTRTTIVVPLVVPMGPVPPATDTTSQACTYLH
jgi:hypothetical protein